ncbi:hypothetical protein PR048_000141 [Dryococelus australis]|uniref:Heparanase n=1 Tax=Dryococelus australis TaxID=614101 RepID=A0ABQ9IEZ2_9NEOP|nr:hypothetical protein PR048_000141 [Dryococelus australis]
MSVLARWVQQSCRQRQYPTRWQHLVTVVLLWGELQVSATPLQPRADAFITLDSSALKVVHEVNERLLSFTLDSSYIMERWVDKHMRDEKFLKMASHLAPAYLRVGGTESDAMLFKESSSLEDRQNGEVASRDFQTFYMTGDEWKLINEFVAKADLKLVFCINALHRSDGSPWDPSNAKQLLDSLAVVDVFTEPDLYSAMYHKYVTTSQLAEDFATLRSLLNSYPRYKSSLLIGPDVFSSDWYLGRFLTSENNTLTETSSAYKGGATNITDRFVDGFMWLDKLGLAAKLGVDVVCRQNLYGNKYSLLNIDNFDPNPDWWLSVLYKKLVGTGILNTTIPTGSVRLYAQCSKTSPGSIVLFGMNLNSQGADVQVKSSATGVKAGKVLAYVLTGESGLQSQTVLLNGKRLVMESNYSLPKLEPVTVSASPLHLPAFSLAFFVLEDIKVTACKW